MSLFKYTTTEIGVNILKDSRVRFTQPLSINDPFDSSPVVKINFSKEQLNQILEVIFQSEEKINFALDEAAKQTHSRLPHLSQVSTSPDKIKEEFQQLVIARYGSLLDLAQSSMDIKKVSQEASNYFLSYTGSHVGLFCLSKIPDNILMWSHYSNSHRGIVIEFDETDAFLRNSFLRSSLKNSKVVYASDRPIVEFGSLESSKEISVNIAKKVFFVKSLEWAYEKEYRILRYLDDRTISKAVDANNFPIHLVQIPKTTIKSIILGAKVSSLDESYLLKTINQKGYDNIKIKRARLDLSKFKINIEE